MANTPEKATQDLSVSTNAPGGYNLTASEDQPLTSGAYTIPDVTGDSINISEINGGAWTQNTAYGFGYALMVAGAYINNGEYKQFADTPGETAQTIRSNGGPVQSDNTTVEYKVNVNSIQTAGTYTNNISYVATGTF